MKNIKLIILAVISIVAGLHLLITPYNVNHLVIRMVGVVWILEGINYSLDYINRYLKDKL